MNTKIILSGLVLLASSILHAETPDLTGTWKTIDDKTGYARADVLITQQKNGTYLGKLSKFMSFQTALPLIIVKNAPLIDLPILSGFKQNPKNKDEFIDGHVLDPLSGHVYQGKGRLNARGNVLTLRGFVGTSLLGRTVSWIKVD